MTGIILFDGVCNLCSKSVQFIIKRDRTGYFQFASLQGKAGSQLLKQYHLKNNMESIVLIENGRVYSQSTAALRISRHLSGFWKFFSVLRAIPFFIRDPVYRFIAKNRYNWFGKTESCMVPSKEIRSRFLD